MRPRATIAPPALLLAALLVLGACDRPHTGPHATTNGIPDPAREAAVRALAPSVAPRIRAMLRDSLRVHVTKSAVIPSFTYHWATWTPPGADTALRAVAVIAGGEAAAVRDPHEWSNAVGRIAWSPSSFRQAAIACAEAARAAGDRAREEADLFLGARTLAAWALRDSVAILRLKPPVVTRIGGAFNRWRAELWMGDGHRAIRYRCVFTPRTGRRGPLAEFERTDSVHLGRSPQQK